MTASPPPVIVRIPESLGHVEVCVRHEEYGVEVDVRPAFSGRTWTPVGILGGSFEVRSA